MSHILIAGLGDLGAGLARALLADGHRVSGIRRGDSAPAGVELYSQDLFQGAALLPPDRVDLLVIILTPSDYSEAGYLAAYLRAPLTLLDALAARQPLPPILFVSSTAVFGDVQGEVDETTPPQPSRYNGRVMLAAEQEISARGLATVVRFSGIYGPGRSRLLNKVEKLARGEEALPAPAWSNRIHRDDCVGLLQHLAGRWLAGEDVPPVVVGTDNHPVSNLDVYAWLAQQRGLPLTVPTATPTGKRIISRYIAEGLYRLRFQDYRQGYQALLPA
ncbi:NAD-dependent epimerase/dehydratase family protein [Alloalcanivorax mobilis]|uniref:NAD-dependent epimerase/dehydratase family protein n=1 Tax=Alloalcanivorax mobilis TaxID=2019569 RepID=UPI000C7737C3|nr:NAD-dependent epimerase/dehydratase family protein [Alloalcanivorax mobilis]